MDVSKLSFRLQLARCNVFRGLKERLFGSHKVVKPQRIIVGGATLLGDMVMMGPLVQALKTEFPEAKIDILVPKGWGDFAKHMMNINEAIESHINNARWFCQFKRQYGKRWDLAVIPFAYSLIPFFYALGSTNIRSFPDPKGRRTNQVHQKVPVPQKAEHMSRMMLALSSAPDGQFLAPHFDKAESVLPQMLQHRRYAILHPGASHTPRIWPAERYAAIAAQLHQKGLGIVLTGGPGEEPLTKAIADLCDFEVLDLAGKTSLEALLATCAHAQLVLGPDTGIMHLARAVNVPSVTLMGQTQNLVYGIDAKLHNAERSRAIYIDDLPCRDFNKVFKYEISGIANCRRHQCLYPDTPCLQPVTSEQVMQLIGEVLS